MKATPPHRTGRQRLHPPNLAEGGRKRRQNSALTGGIVPSGDDYAQARGDADGRDWVTLFTIWCQFEPKRSRSPWWGFAI